MALIEFDEGRQKAIDARSYTRPEAEYEIGDVEALGVSFNSIMASVHQNRYNQMAVDESTLPTVPLDQESKLKFLEEKGYSPSVRDNVLTSYQESWADVVRRAEYVKSMETIDSQVQENWSTAGMLAAGVSFAVLDYDAFLINPTLAGVSKLKKISNLNTTSRIAKTAEAAIAGGVVGAESMATYEATTGIYKDNSLVHSALFGMGLGGSLGFFLSKAPEAKDLVTYYDKNGNPSTKAAVQEEKVIDARTELEEIDDAIKIAKEAKANRSQLKKDIDRSEKNDRGTVRFDKRLQRERLDENKTLAQQALETARGALNAAKEGLSTVTKEIKDLTSSVGKTQKANTLKKELKAEQATKKKELSPVKGQITKLTKKLEELKDKTGDDIIAQRKEINKKLKSYRSKANKIQRRLDTIERNLENAPKDTTKTIETGLARLGELRVAQAASEEAVNTARLARDEAQASSSAAVKEFNDHKTFVARDDVADGFTTSQLKEKLLEDPNFQVSGLGLKKLLEYRNKLSDDLAKLEDDTFDISTLKDIRAKRQNFVEKLSKELEDIQKADDFRTTDAFKNNLPDWAKKLLISPIEKLLASLNEKVAGFAQRLHGGTLNHGVASTENAMNLKKMHETRMTRMHHAIRYNYHEAIKTGAFKGSYDEFEDLVGENVFRVTGKMQRDLYTGIDGAIVGEARAKIAEERAGSIQRNHISQNKYIQKSTDEVLDYYEYIHHYGKELGMEAFAGLGKGYAKRIYDPKVFEELGRNEVIKRLFRAQRNYAESTNSLLTKEVEDEFIKIAEDTYDAVMKADYNRNVLIQPLGGPKKSTPNSLKTRTVNAFDDELADLLNKRVRATTSMYGLNVHGRLALKEKIGVYKDDDINFLVDQLGATQKELSYTRAIIEEILGVRQLSKNPLDPVTRIFKGASTFSSAMHTLAFAVPTVTEVASIAKEFGWSKTIDGLVGKPSEIYNMYRYGTPSEKNTVEMMISYSDGLFSYRATRYDVENGIDSVGRMQEFGDKVVHAQSVFGGLLPVTDMLRMTTASLGVDFLARMSVAKKISKADEMRINDMGFSVADLAEVRRILDVDSTGRINNTNRGSWGKLDRKMTLGIQTLVDRTILHPDGATLPLFMTNMNEGQFLPRVMFKFMRFPIESYERLLIRGIQEADAKQLMALGGNIAMWTAILAMKDAMRDEDKQKYSEDDGFNRLMLDSFIYNSFTAGPIAAIDTMSGVLTGKNFTNEFRYSFGGAVLSDFEKARRGDLTLSLPGYNWNIGDSVGQAMTSIFGLEELNKE